MAIATAERVQKYRASLREAGLRPLQIWVVDSRRAGFAEDCRRQSRRVAQSDASDAGIGPLLAGAAGGIDGWV